MSWSPWARELDESNIKKLISLWPAGLISQKQRPRICELHALSSEYAPFIPT